MIFIVSQVWTPRTYAEKEPLLRLGRRPSGPMPWTIHAFVESVARWFVHVGANRILLPNNENKHFTSIEMNQVLKP